MSPRLDYTDTATFIDTVTGDLYGDDVAGTETQVPGLYVQETGRQHSSGQEQLTSRSILHLDPDNSYIAGKQYRLEGLVVRINPFGAPDSSQVFRIRSVTPARDSLLGNTVHNVECELDLIGDFVS